MEGLGLLTAKANQHVALRGVKVSAKVAGLGQRVTVEQTFVNKETVAIEAVYTFPLPDGAAVTGFEIITGDRVLTGVIEEREKAEAKYAEAINEGHGAFMAEMHRPDVFSTRVGNIKPRQAVTVKLTYVVALTVTDRVMRIAYPTTVAPRYVSSAGMDPTDALVDGDALNPPHVLSVPYGLTLEVEIALGVGVKSVGSSSHGVRVERVSAEAQSGEGGRGEAYRVTLQAGIAAMDRDAVLEVELEKDAVAGGVSERSAVGGKEEVFTAVTFVPTFDDSEMATSGPAEVVFLVDCSGSMEGQSIAQAKRALALCLRSLNIGDRFNIVCFGDSFVQMSPEPVTYSQATMEKAIKHVAAIDANLGGTEIYEPLLAILKTPPAGKVRDVIVLTDGQVSNEPAVVKLAAKYKRKCRIFSFGIGPGSSAFLVNGMAKASGGAAEFVGYEERIEEKVLRTFSRMASPMVTDVHVDWGSDVTLAGEAVPAIFVGDAVCVYGRGGREVRTVELRCKLGDKDKSWKVAVAETRTAKNETRNEVGMLAQLWARERIAAEREDEVAVSRTFSVLSAKTAFMAVEHRSIEERTKGLPALRRVAVAVPPGWHGMEGTATMDCLMDLAAPAAAPVFAEAEAMPMTTRARAGGGGIAGAAGRIAQKAGTFFSKRFESPKPAKPAEPADDLQSWLLKQSAEGWFEDEPLRTGSTSMNGRKVDVKKWIDALAALHVQDRKQRETALVLAILRVHFADQATLWKRAFDKGIKWLKKENAAAAAWVEKAAA